MAVGFYQPGHQKVSCKVYLFSPLKQGFIDRIKCAYRFDSFALNDNTKIFPRLEFLIHRQDWTTVENDVLILAARYQQKQSEETNPA